MRKVRVWVGRSWEADSWTLILHSSLQQKSCKLYNGVRSWLQNGTGGETEIHELMHEENNSMQIVQVS